MVGARGSFIDSMQPFVEIWTSKRWGKNDLTAQSHRFAFSQALIVAPLRLKCHHGSQSPRSVRSVTNWRKDWQKHFFPAEWLCHRFQILWQAARHHIVVTQASLPHYNFMEISLLEPRWGQARTNIQNGTAPHSWKRLSSWKLSKKSQNYFCSLGCIVSEHWC